MNQIRNMSSKNAPMMTTSIAITITIGTICDTCDDGTSEGAGIDLPD
jgi:hypothetical protein